MATALSEIGSVGNRKETGPSFIPRTASYKDTLATGKMVQCPETGRWSGKMKINILENSKEGKWPGTEHSTGPMDKSIQASLPKSPNRTLVSSVLI